MKIMFKKFVSWCDSQYSQLIKFNDAPHKIALSFAIGVFLGILPFTGVLAAIAAAWFLRLNKAAAVLGSALTNTWLSLLVFGLAVQTNAVFLHLNGPDIQEQARGLMHDFHWKTVFSASFLQALVPVAVGFLIISFIFAFISYFLALGAILWHRAVR